MPEDNLIAERLKNATPLETLQHIAFMLQLILERAPDDTPASQLRPPLEPNPMQWLTRKNYKLTRATQLDMLDVRGHLQAPWTWEQAAANLVFELCACHC